MIKKLRYKFILVSLLSVLLVLGSAISAMNIYNYAEIRSDANKNLTSIIESGFDDHSGELVPGEPPQDQQGTQPGAPGEQGQPGKPDGPGEPFEDFMREQYFLVSFDSNGSIVQYDFNHAFKYNQENGLSIAKSFYDAGVPTGKQDNLRFKRVDKNDLTYIAVIDLTLQFEDADFFLVTSSIISSASFVVFAALILLASFIVFKPAAESYKKQKQFITNASHELKTPLTIISTDLELIEMDAGKSEWTESIKDQVERLTNMTNQLVFLSKMEEDDIDNIMMDEIPISEMLSQALDTFSPAFSKANLKLDFSVEKGVTCKGNMNFIDELFQIFLENALKYTKEEGNVFVSLTKEKNKVYLTFENDVKNGSKIDAKQLFERFYRVDSQTKGSGIGLSIAKEIVRIHKGEIKASVANDQIIFELTL